MSTEHNGWTNYETWAVKLWIDNDEGSQDYWNECAQEIADEAKEEGGRWSWETPDRRAIAELAEVLQAEHDENAPTEISGVYADLLSAALSSVNWREIAEAILTDTLEPNFWNEPVETDAELFTGSVDGTGVRLLPEPTCTCVDPFIRPNGTLDVVAGESLCSDQSCLAWHKLA